MNSEVRDMQTQANVTTTREGSVVLLSCSLCGPVGIYSCGSTLAVTHHLTTHQENK